MDGARPRRAQPTVRELGQSAELAEHLRQRQRQARARSSAPWSTTTASPVYSSTWAAAGLAGTARTNRQDNKILRIRDRVRETTDSAGAK
jgi:hypothetical protein